MKKQTIIFVLVAGALAAALVFDGISRRHSENNQPGSQAQMTQTADATANSNANSNDQATNNDAAQGTDPNQDPNQTQNQDATATDDAQGQNGDDANAAVDGQPADGAAADNGDATADAAPAPAIFVPSGTTFTVRLGEELGSSISQTGQRFSGTLDNDIVVHGQTVIAAGSAVHGRVVLARPVGQLAGEAKLQLRITSINDGNGNLAVASSTRSFEAKIKGKNKVGKFMKGLVKRASGNEREVVLAEQTAYSFTLEKRLQVQ